MKKLQEIKDNSKKFEDMYSAGPLRDHLIISRLFICGLHEQLEQAQAENEQLKADKQKLVAGYERLSKFPHAHGMYSSDYIHQFARQVLSEVNKT